MQTIGPLVPFTSMPALPGAPPAAAPLLTPWGTDASLLDAEGDASLEQQASIGPLLSNIEQLRFGGGGQGGQQQQSTKQDVQGVQAAATGVGHALEVTRGVQTAARALPIISAEPSTSSFAGAQKVLGPLGVAGGLYEGVGAVQQLQQGHIVDGSVGLAQAGTGTAAAAGGAAKGFNLVGDAAQAAKLTKATGVLAGASAVLEGGLQIFHGIKSGSTQDLGLGSAKAAGGGLLLAGAATGNPIIAGAGALLYGGAEVYQNRKAIGHALQAVGRGIVKGVDAVGHVVGKAAHAVGHAVGQAAHAVGHAVGKAAHAVGHFISSLF